MLSMRINALMLSDSVSNIALNNKQLQVNLDFGVILPTSVLLMLMYFL